MATNKSLTLNRDLLDWLYEAVKENTDHHETLFSFFAHPIRNITPAFSMDLRDLFELLISDQYKQQTDELRFIQDKNIARKYKAENFDYVTFSGTFKKRSNSDLILHSGLLTLDIDHISDTRVVRQQLLEDPYFETELLFTSPSGDGLKWIVRIDIENASHENYFKAIRNYLNHTYQIEVDKSGKDVARACFIPHAPEAFINPKHK